MMNNFSGPPNNPQENEYNAEKQEAIKNLKEAYEKFKQDHNFESLFAITNKEEALTNLERSAAKKGLIPLVTALKSLKGILHEKEPEEYENLKE
jgi:hypothetical protein